MSSPSSAAATKAPETVPFSCPEEGHKHGETNNCYVSHRCRCQDCKDGCARRAGERRRLIAYGRWVEPQYADPARVIAHIAYLQSFGHTYDWIAERANTSARTVWIVNTGIRKRLGVDIESRILALRPDPDSLNQGHVIPAIGVHRRIQALAVLGWSQAELARRLNVHIDTVSKYLLTPGTFVRTHIKIAELYDEFWDQQPPSATPAQKGSVTMTKRRAVKAGWVGPLAWDNIDDPDETPNTTGVHDLEDHWDNRYDHAVVQAAIDGLKPDLTPREREDVVRRLHSSAWSAARIAAWTGGNVKTVERIRVRLGLRTLNQNDLIDAA